MGPRRKKAAPPTKAASTPRRLTRQATRSRNAKPGNDIPDIYEEMLAEAAAISSEELNVSPRPLKRRRVSPEPEKAIDDLFESPPPSPPRQDAQLADTSPSRTRQIVYDDFEGSEGSEESDIEFEDIELEPSVLAVPEDEQRQSKLIQIDLSKSALETPKRAIQRRKPVSKAERMMRLDVHKWHLLSLIGHGLYRNSWCSKEEIHAILKPLVPRRVINLLHTDDDKPQYERNYSFTKGIEEICALWRQQWKVNVAGLRRSYWREDVDACNEADEGEDLDLEDFTAAARMCCGSRDLGAQLFTALLRSIAIDARLVFSLQVLPFTGSSQSESPAKSRTSSNYIEAPAQNYGARATTASPFAPPARPSKKAKKIIDSPYPVFWTEVLTPNQTWIPLDPVVRNSISKPKTQFEPPLSDSHNSMTYVVAYEEDNSARDVTRRYTQWFNAKTRKARVESTKHGEEWYDSALAVLQKRLREPRDEIEVDELAKRINSEGMPNNIQDFKNHPVYVLERHMRVNEVLQPKREVGKVNVGTSKNGKIESVYRRRDVHLCRSADAWYRRGRDVKVSEQPLKHVLPKSRKGIQETGVEPSDDENENERNGVGLYAEYQTSIYEPPPVVNGKIPRNAYGNLDVYVPSMIPPGAVHIAHPLAAAACRALGVDFADAVTGFEFKGRQGTAVISGVVVAEQYTAAVSTAIDGLEQEGSEEIQQARSRILLGLWKRILQALRVRDRIEAEYGDMGKEPQKSNYGDKDNDDDDGNSVYHDDDAEAGDQGGGFMLEDEPTEEKVQEQAANLQALKSKMPTILPEEVTAVSIKITRSPHKTPIQEPDPSRDNHAVNSNTDDLFEEHEDHDETSAGGFQPEADNDVEAGGFMPEDDADETGGGGFLPEDSPPPTTHPKKPTNPKLAARSLPNAKLSHDDAFVNPDTPSSSRGGRPRAPTLGQSHAHSAQSGPDTMDAIHSDAEEDTALQIAIAQSLAVHTPRHVPQSVEAAGPSKNGGEDRMDIDEARDREVSVAADGDADVDVDVDGDKGSGISRSNSLLSHNPSEDDAEPDWLNEALD